MAVNAGGRFVPSPHVDSTPPQWLREEWRRRSEAVAGFSGDGSPQWGENPLTGPRTIRVGDRSFRIPREASVKRSGRAGTAWVHLDGQTFVYSELGCLLQSEAERRSTPWTLL